MSWHTHRWKYIVLPPPPLPSFNCFSFSNPSLHFSLNPSFFPFIPAHPPSLLCLLYINSSAFPHLYLLFVFPCPPLSPPLLLTLLTEQWPFLTVVVGEAAPQPKSQSGEIKKEELLPSGHLNPERGHCQVCWKTKALMQCQFPSPFPCIPLHTIFHICAQQFIFAVLFHCVYVLVVHVFYWRDN